MTWLALTREANPMHDAREYDTVVATGEQVTSGLLALCLQQMGVSARSWLGWQIPICAPMMFMAGRAFSACRDR